MQKLQQFLIWCSVPGTIFPGLMALFFGTKWQFVIGLVISAALIAKAHYHPTLRLFPPLSPKLDMASFLIGALMAELLLTATVGPKCELFAVSINGWIYLALSGSAWYCILSLDPRIGVTTRQVAGNES